MTQQKITTKQSEILTLLYKYKFLNRIQIQQFLKHKDHRRINSWLKDLTEKEYVKRIWSNRYYERTIPAVYYLAPNSLEYLSEKFLIKPKYFQKIQEEVKSPETYVGHSLFLAEIGLSFLNKNTDEKINTTLTEAQLADPGLAYGLWADIKVKPNLLVFQKAKPKNMTRYYLFEILDKYSSTILIRSKIKKYFKIYHSCDWEVNMNGKFPDLLFVCPSLYLLIYAKRYVRRIRAEEYDDCKITFQFALANDVKAMGAEGHIWEKA